MNYEKIKFMDNSLRDGFQSCYGARVKTEDFLQFYLAVDAENYNFEWWWGKIPKFVFLLSRRCF